MSTYLSLRQSVAAALGDPSNQTFTDPMLQAIVQQAWAEVGRIAPQRFQTDIAPVANQNKYSVKAPGVSTTLPEVELTTVELWDGSQTPALPLKHIQPLDAEVSSWTENGWKVWDGQLYLPRWVPLYISGHEAAYLIRVWGYSPYEPLVNDADVSPLSHEREQALVLYARLEGIRAMAQNRTLFTQWQTHSGNTDTSFAGLLNDVNVTQEAWRHKANAITVLRESPS